MLAPHAIRHNCETYKIGYNKIISSINACIKSHMAESLPDEIEKVTENTYIYDAINETSIKKLIF